MIEAEKTQDELIKQAEPQEAVKERKVISIEVTETGVNVNWSKNLKRIELIGSLEIAKSTIENWFEEMAYRVKLEKESKIIKPGQQNGFIPNLKKFLARK
ncbi:MAG: hypothetical protein WC390_09055 [Sulfurimonas sp.]|jgi:hypothetical protein